MARPAQPLLSAPSTATPTAYSYQRFSSPTQSDGDSVRRQTQLRDEWLNRSGAILDTSLTFVDAGVSGFTGAHRENPDRNALAGFLELVRRGRIPRGSFLIVESLDRLTREHIRPALTLLLNLIDSGIRIVQLLPVEATYDDKVEPMNLMLAIMELSRGHSESRMKSERVGRAWAEKKKRALADGEVLTRACPAWIKVEGGKYVLTPSKAASVRRVFTLAIGGLGIRAITKKLNTEKVPPIARAAHWAYSYVTKLLKNRGSFGEYQPHKGHAGPDRKPDGPPIPNYYPPVITEDEWHTAQIAMLKRKLMGGRPPAKQVSIFSGIIKDARDGGSLMSTDKGKKAYGPVFVSSRAIHGIEGAVRVTFPRDTLERAILSRLKEIDPREILPNEEPAADEVSARAGRLATIEARIIKIKAALTSTDGDVVPLVESLRALDIERLAEADGLAIARRAASSPISEAWGEARSLVSVLDESDNPEATRMRLRGAIRRIVERVVCLFVDRNAVRLAAVQLDFIGGQHRVYLIWHHRGEGNATGTTRPRTWGTWSAPMRNNPSGFNLRRKADVKELEKMLTKLDIEKLLAADTTDQPNTLPITRRKRKE